MLHAFRDAAALMRALVIVATMTGCTSFMSVRSAEARRGGSTLLQASLATPPGDEAAWFFAPFCAEECNRWIPGVDVAFTFGRRAPASVPTAVTLGTSGLYPYVEAYAQLDTAAARPFGIGARLGIPAIGWASHQLYTRRDFVTPSGRLLWNAALVYHTGNSPNGENPGRLFALVNGFGWEVAAEGVAFTPSFGLVVSRAERWSYGQHIGPEVKVFGTTAVSLTFRKRR